MSELVKLLSRETGLAEFVIRRVMLTAPQRYKVFYIPKRNGSRRQIAQPSREVKTCQRVLTSVLLNRLPVHECATAYKVGSNIKDNAQRHIDSGALLKMDFKDFFPSIKKSDWMQFCRKHKCLANDEEIELTSNLLFQKQSEHRTLRLAIGAPSSPALSNILMFEFDSMIAQALRGTKVVYSRYADDLTFSAPRLGYLKGVQTLVRKTLRNLEFPKIKVNEEKTVIVTKKYKRVITGLVLTTQGHISVGKDRRRGLRAAINRAKKGVLSEIELKQLAGLISYVSSIEPSYVEKLRHHYGFDVFNSIFKSTRIKGEIK